jgi:chemotaxis protein methyltransferase CheR
MNLQATERKLVFDYIYSVSAIALETGKEYLVESRLSELAVSTGAKNFADFIQKAQADYSGTLKRKIIDGITTGETLFFRDTAPFELMRHKLIPDLIDRQNRSPIKSAIRIWSAACSTGQELYSIAILLKEMLPDPGRYQFRLLGTDLSDQAVARASAGYFNSIEMGRGLSEAERARSFVPDPKGWKIRDEVRSLASFRRFNLMDDFSSLGKFDIILCRNVAIYFNEKDKASLFQRLAQRLEPHGSLLIGSMESLGNLCPTLESKRHLRAVYYQLKA